jgi:hypothetical protein
MTFRRIHNTWEEKTLVDANRQVLMNPKGPALNQLGGQRLSRGWFDGIGKKACVVEQQNTSHFANQSLGYDFVTLHYSSDVTLLLSVAVV